MLQYLPNSLTFLRVLLTVPLGVFILREEYTWALGVGLLAGASDALDGFLARRLDAQSRFGAALDPLADKLLITVTFLCFAQTGLVPWYLTIAVIARDLLIVAGAVCYHRFIGPFELGATRLSKLNTVIQIAFCVLVLLSQIAPGIPPGIILPGIAAVLFFAAASGFDYVMSWTIRAVQSRHDRV